MKKITIRFADEEIDFCESQGQSFPQYIRDLVHRDQTKNSSIEGDEANTKIKFQPLS